MPKVKTSHGVYDISEQAFQEMVVTQARPYHIIPASWWEPETAENMSRWIKLAEKFGWDRG